MSYSNIQKSISLSLIPISIISAIIFHYYNTELFVKTYFLSITVLISLSILFYHFPIFIKILHTKPVYYEDIILLKNNNINPYKLQNIFLLLNGISSILFMVLSANYIYYRINYGNWFEFIGIFGGIAIVYTRIQTYLGKLFLSILLYIKNNRYNDEGIEMVRLNDVESQVSLDMNITDTPWLWCWCQNINENDHICQICN